MKDKKDMEIEAMILFGIMAVLVMVGFCFLVEALSETIGKKATTWSMAALLFGAAAYIYLRLRKLGREIEYE